MLVEINLLPEREPRKFAFVVILSSIIAAMVLIGFIYYLQIHFTKTEMASIDRQIMITKRLANKQNDKDAEAVTESNSITQIKNAVDWANTYPIQTIPVMDHLTALLPERGFIQSFSYTEQGTISITVQFDSAREAAYFLNSLENSDWFEEASLNSLATTEPPSQTDTSTGNSNTGSTNQNGQSAQGVTPANPENNPNGNTQNQTTGQVENAQTKQTSVAASATKPAEKKNNNILPRYTGQFEIKLNKETISKIIHKVDSKEEGGTGS